MSEADAATSVNVAEKLGFKNGDLIQEFGYDDDVDFDLRDDIEDLTGSELLDEDECRDRRLKTSKPACPSPHAPHVTLPIVRTTLPGLCCPTCLGARFG